jgi:peptide chain release factor 1
MWSLKIQTQDAKNGEIRAGTGGDESKYFAGDLFRMYTNTVSRGWELQLSIWMKVHLVDLKRWFFEGGEDVWNLEIWSGVHRVQRVPQTETQGRVHTSAATVMVLPEAEEFDANRYEWCEGRFFLFFRTRWTIYNKISRRLTHSNRSGSMSGSKSQHKNKDKAFGFTFPFVRTLQKTSWRCYKTYVSG